MQTIEARPITERKAKFITEWLGDQIIDYLHGPGGLDSAQADRVAMAAIIALQDALKAETQTR